MTPLFRIVVILSLVSVVRAADPSPAELRPTADYVPAEISAMTRASSSELREVVDRFVSDRDELERFYSVEGSQLRIRRMREFYGAWKARLDAMDYESLGVEGRIDWQLLTRYLAHGQSLLDREEAREREMATVVPFGEALAGLQESRRLMRLVDPQAAAATLDKVRRQVEDLRAAVAATKKESSKVAPLVINRVVAARSVARIAALREQLADWDKFYDGYDPSFGWWVRVSYEGLNKALDAYVKDLKKDVLGIEEGKDEPIVGDPIGRAGLMAEIDHEMVAYSPEELLQIANREFAWCDAELKKASREMGLGDDWKAALEKVKQDHLQPGSQPGLVRDLALEAIRYVSDHDMVTIPPLAADFWRIEMMSPARQKVAPFFLGGPDILVAFPTDAMDYDAKLQSLRANNVHFARATVFHELVPGHHLQYYYESRSNPHRELFTTPFWVEGWAVWWEFQLYDMGFPRSPEDKIGMLFWRTHRCARIVFSLNYHLGNWTPEQCVDFLVDRVGHERASAQGEVRRSFNGTFPPMYQAGYMLGALQLRSLHGELVNSGKMTNRAFHDAIMVGGPMPIDLVRARLEGVKLPKDYRPTWRFADPIN
jgi:uncharacterized protein (DUF885 family)